LALDAAEPIATSGANGLNGRAFDGDPPPADLVQASAAMPFVALDIALRYRRGGGAVEAEMTVSDVETRPASAPLSPNWSLTLTAPGAESLRLGTAGATPGRAIVPRERFCAFAKGGRLVVAPARDDSPVGGAQDAVAGFALAAMAGAKALIAEACP
jgi:hypothetical protein